MVLGEGRGESWAVFAEGRECGTVGAGCLVSLADIAVLSAAPALSPLPVFPPVLLPILTSQISGEPVYFLACDLVA